MDIIRRLTKEATEIIDAVAVNSHTLDREDIRTGLDVARIQVELAQLHVAMSDWPIEDDAT